jgi:hypothetical protein
MTIQKEEGVAGLFGFSARTDAGVGIHENLNLVMPIPLFLDCGT